MKNQTLFEKQLVAVQRYLSQAGMETKLIIELIDKGELAQAYEECFALADKTERMTLITRVLPAYTGAPDAMTRMAHLVSGLMPIDIGFSEQNWFVLRIPALLPKKEKGSANYIRTSLYPAMKEFFRGKQPVLYPHCVMVFRHIYNKRRPERLYRDHDNIELNMVVDILSLYLLKDDMPVGCSHYYCSAAGESDCTEVYIVPAEEFKDWIEIAERRELGGIKLYEKQAKA